jgi:signal transduction histidine kinase
MIGGRRLGVRARITLIATAVVGLTLAAASVVFITETRSSLSQSVETTVTARSADISAQVSEGVPPDPIPLVRRISAQIVHDGEVGSSTPDIEGAAPIVTVNGVPGSPKTVRVAALDSGDEEGEDEAEEEEAEKIDVDVEGPFLVAVNGVRIENSVVTVLTAASLAGVEEATRILVPLMAITMPAITLLVGLTVWRLTGRAFGPVEAMANQADSITFGDLHLRVPEPQADDEIRHLALVLNRMLERIETSVARQRRFIADAGHELRSPLATLITMAEVADANPETFKVAELAGDVAEQGRRMALLVDDLLVLARVDEAHLELDREWFDLAALARDVVAATRSDRIGVNVEQLLPVPVFGDHKRIGQAVRNLVDNACRHARSTVVVETSLSEGAATLTVADDGPGIPDEDRERVFERFVRLDDARSRDIGGTGLGLSVALGIVRAHGGEILVEDSAGLGGAEFVVRLPASGAGGDRSHPG